jgi:hypothetical protein
MSISLEGAFPVPRSLSFYIQEDLSITFSRNILEIFVSPEVPYLQKGFLFFLKRFSLFFRKTAASK